MQRRVCAATALATLILALLLPSAGAVPLVIEFQGKLTSASGGPITNPSVPMLFRIYDDPDDGSLLWEEGQTVIVERGIYSVGLGTGSTNQGSFDASLFSLDDLWLEVVIYGEPLSPRLRLTSVAYALQAEQADTLDGLDSTAFSRSTHQHAFGDLTGSITDGQIPATITRDTELTAGLAGKANTVHTHSGADIASGVINQAYIDGAIARDTELAWGNLAGIPAGFADGVDDTGIVAENDPQVGSNTTNYVPRWNGSALATGSIFDDGSKVGIGTATPVGRLSVHTSTGGAIYAVSQTPTGITIQGHHSGDGYGVYGSTAGGYPAVGGSHSGGGTAVVGYTGYGGIGVMGSVNTNDGVGVAGLQSGYTTADITNMSAPGGFFGGRIGAFALSKYTNGYGLLGENRATDGTYTTGVVGRTSSPTGYGGRFSGGTALYAQAADNSKPDLLLAGNSSTNDNGVLTSDPAYASSDLSITAYDDVNIQIDRNDDEAGVFWISNGAAANVFSVDESGTVRVNGAVVHSSDRNLKEDFEEVDPETVLEGVVSLPVGKWRYRGQEETHLGPVAQDFYAAFGLGEDELGIATVDADGVALASIQALYRMVEELKAENATLKARLERLESVREEPGMPLRGPRTRDFPAT